MSSIIKNSVDELASYDAGQRLRVSELTTLIDLKHLHDKQPDFIDEVLNGAATSVHSTTEARVRMSVSSNGDYAIRQTFMRFNYQSGKSQFILNTFDNFQPTTDVTKRIGYFNSSSTAPYTAGFDGIFLESDGTTVRLKVVKTGTEVFNVAQADWDDPLDGTGSSGAVVDWENSQGAAFDFLWLGVDKIRFYLELNGNLTLIHTCQVANELVGVYMSSPNHSIRYEIRSTGGADHIDQICSSVNVEGARNRGGKLKAFNNNQTAISLPSPLSLYAVIGTRLKTTHLDVSVDLLVFSLLGTSADNFLWELRRNPTVAGTFTFNDQTNSGVQIAVGTSANTVTGGDVIDSGYIAQRVANRDPIENALRLGSAIDGTRDEFVLCVRPITNNLSLLPSYTRREEL